MRAIAIKASNNKELEEQVRAVQENAYRDGVDAAIGIVKAVRYTEGLKGSKVVDVLERLISTLPKLYDGIGIPLEVDSSEERLNAYRQTEQMSEREALYREFGAQEDDED